MSTSRLKLYNDALTACGESHLASLTEDREPRRLLDHVWDENIDPFTNTVRVTISKLRRKLADAGSPDMIETIVGSGYRLVA